MAINYALPAIVAVLVTIQAAMCNQTKGIPDVKTFFGKKVEYLTQINFAHGVNSKAALDKALSDEKIMMLEADVIIGHLVTDNTTMLPIMAHPPAIESDLSLEQFISSVMKNSKKGVKLDFKSIEAFRQSRTLLEMSALHMTVPVMLNADILAGPVVTKDNKTVENPAPITTQEFLLGASKSIPESTLSIGWTTPSGSYGNTTEGYTEAQIKEMMTAIASSKVKSSVTYPVRAALAVNSVKVLSELMKNTTANNPTLTIWTGEKDVLNLPGISKLIKEIGYDKVYIELPDSIKPNITLKPAPPSSGAPSQFVSATMLVGSVIASLAIAKLL